MGHARLASVEAIKRLALRAGFEIEWIDTYGKPRRVLASTLVTLLEQIGLPCRSSNDARCSLAMLENEQAQRKLPPLITAQSGQAITLPAIKPGTRYRIEFASGGIFDGRCAAPQGAPLWLAPITETGYHTLIINDQRTCLAVAPRRCYTIEDACRARGAAPRLAGINAQIYSLRRRDDGGIGDYSALAMLAAASVKHGIDALAISPAHAMTSARPELYSPYAPSSRRFLNVAYIDPSALFGANALRATLAAMQLGDEWARLEALPLIDWPRAVTLKLRILRTLFEQFCVHEHATPLAREFAAFCANGAQALEDHARFEAIQAAQDLSGMEDFADARSSAVEAFAATRRRDIDFYLFLQWLAAKGLAHARQAAAEMTIGLIADLAVGCNSAGSDAWSNRSGMLPHISIGAPPDTFNQAGQSWGLTTFSPRALHQQGFSAFIEMLRATFAYAGGIRIDHILGLRRLWLIPEGQTPENGAYLRYPTEDLLRLIALESQRHHAIVIGEDLGTVPAGFRECLSAYGLLGIRVLWFEHSDGHFKPPNQWDANAIASTSTHDLPTIKGWWRGSDIAWRSRIGQTAPRADGRDPVELAQQERAAQRQALWHALQKANLVPVTVPPSIDAPINAPLEAALAFVAASAAPLVTYPLEDLLGLHEQPNLPGSINEHPNWRQRNTRPIDALFEDAALTRRLDLLSQVRAEYPAVPENGQAEESSTAKDIQPKPA